METPKSPNLRRVALIAVAFVILSTVLLFFARDVIREVIVLPLSYIVWVIGVIVDYTPQVFFWIVLLYFIFRIASLGLSRKRKADPSQQVRPYLAEAEIPSSNGRALYWARKVELLRAGRGAYYSRSFHSTLGRLLWDLLVYRYRQTPRQIEDGLRDGSLNVPQEVREYLLDSLRPPETMSISFFSYLWARISQSLIKWFAWLRPAFQRIAQAESRSTAQSEASHAAWIQSRAERDDPRVRYILKYMEEELEVSHDDASR